MIRRNFLFFMVFLTVSYDVLAGNAEYRLLSLNDILPNKYVLLACPTGVEPRKIDPAVGWKLPNVSKVGGFVKPESKTFLAELTKIDAVRASNKGELGDYLILQASVLTGSEHVTIRREKDRFSNDVYMLIYNNKHSLRIYEKVIVSGNDAVSLRIFFEETSRSEKSDATLMMQAFSVDQRK